VNAKKNEKNVFSLQKSKEFTNISSPSFSFSLALSFSLVLLLLFSYL
jgi:hypothetical protein